MLGLNQENIATLRAILTSACDDVRKLDKLLDLRESNACSTVEIGILARKTFDVIQTEVDLLDAVLNRDEQEEE